MNSTPAGKPRRLQLGHIPIDALTLPGALDAIETMITAGSGGTVFTPNVDHVVLAEQDGQLRRAYQRVTLSLADGMPIVVAGYLLGVPLPAKVSGSDLVVPLMERASQRGWRVYFLGAAEGVATRAAQRLSTRFPRLVVCGTASPRVTIDESPAVRARLVARVQAVRPDLVLVALGAPKQEIWIDDTFALLRPAVLLGVGASLDFVAEVTRRAPPWMSSVGLEWLFRLAVDPRRLWRRYLLRDPKFLAIVLRTARSSRRGRAHDASKKNAGR